MKRFHDSKICVLIRVHDYNKLSLLEAALHSLAKQSYAHVEPILLLQNAKAEERRLIDDLIKRVFVSQRGNAASYEICECFVTNGRDGRTLLLNAGIKESYGRYLAFLDFDDLVEVDAYEVLIRALNSNPQAAVACGACALDYIRFDGSRWITTKTLMPFSWGQGLPDLYKENFIPLHSFVIDRARVNAGDLQFNEGMTLLEDYDFLLRLSSTYLFDFSCLKTLVARYRARMDGSNTNPTLRENLSDSDQALLLEAQAQIDKLKSELPARMSIAEVAALVPERKKGSPVKRFVKRMLSPLLGLAPGSSESLKGVAKRLGIKESKI